jgi:ribosomal protein S18 acetylase RimI-like enzyme
MTTPTTAPRLRVAGPDDIDRVTDLITDAFDHMPVIHYLVPEPSKRWPTVREWYRLYVAHAITGAGQVVVTEDGAGAAVWFDRTGKANEPDGYAEQLVELAGEYLERFDHLDAQMDANHPAEPHWHLLFLAVHPDRWGQGYGSALMNHTHTTQLDADGIAAYLEATSDDNARLYRRHGYQDMTPPTIAVTDSIHLYRMWRPSQTPTPNPARPAHT